MGKYAVINPATGETVKEYPEISDEELSAAIAAAEDAHRSWALKSSVAERAALVKRVAELHSERREPLAEIIVREMGKPMDQALGEVDFCADIYGFYADNAEKLLADQPIDLLEGDGTALIRRSSVGPLLGIMPWNFPYYQVARFAALQDCPVLSRRPATAASTASSMLSVPSRMNGSDPPSSSTTFFRLRPAISATAAPARSEPVSETPRTRVSSMAFSI